MATHQPAPTRRWRYESTLDARASATAQRRRRRLVIGFLFLSALVGAAVIVALTLRPVPKTAFVAVGFANYSELPVNPFAHQDRLALLGWLHAPIGSQEIRQERASVEEQLRELRSLSPSAAKAVVAYVYGYALLNQQNNHVMLIPNDAPPDALASDGLDLADVLLAIKECPIQDRLVLIDLRPPPSDGWLGRLAAELAPAIRAQVDAAGLDAFVLAACDVGERSLVPQVLGQSVFGHFLARGLAGEADLNGDRAVHARELHQYVTTQVPAWARQTYQTRQTPVLLAGEGARDFVLRLTTQTPATTSDATPPAKPPYPQVLADGWKELDGAMRGRGNRLYPMETRILEAKMLRGERSWRGGAAESAFASDVRAATERLQTLAKVEPLAATLPSLALARRQAGLERAPANAVFNAFDKEFETAFAKLGAAPKPEAKIEAAASLRALLSAPEGPFKAVNKDKNFHLDLAASVLAVATREATLSPQRLELLGKFLKQTERELPAFVETTLLIRLARLAEESPKDWPGSLAEQALRLATDGEFVAAEWGAAGLPLDHLSRAAQDRHDFETLLLAPGFASQAEILRLAQQAQLGYQSLARFVEVWTEAQNVRDRTLAVLPGLAAQLEATPPPSLLPIEEGLRALASLERILSSAVVTPSRPPEVKREVDDLDRLLGGLVPSGQGARLAQQASEKHPENPALTLRAIEALLESSLVLANRAELWNAGYGLAQRLANGELESRGEPTPLPIPNPELQRRFAEQQMAVVEGLAADGPTSGGGSLRQRSAALRGRCERLLDGGLANPKDALRADLLLRVLSDYDARVHAIGRKESPRVAEDAQARRSFRRWLGGRLHYEAIETATTDPEASRLYQRLAAIDPRSVEDVPAVTLETPADGLRVGQTSQLRLRLPFPKYPRPLSVLRQDPDSQGYGLRFPSSEADLKRIANQGAGVLGVLVEPGSAAHSAGVKGVLVRLSVDGWTIHQRVPVTDAAAARVRDELRPLAGTSTDSEAASPSLLENLGLRAAKGQPFHFFLRNTGQKEKKASVELRAGQTLVAASQGKSFTIPPDATIPVAMQKEGAPPLPGGGGATGAERGVSGNLTLVVLEEGKPPRSFPVGTQPRSPRDYLIVERVRNDEEHPRRLALRVRLRKDALPPGVTVVEFVLPETHFATARTKRDVLSPARDSVEIAIDDVKLQDDLRGPAVAYLNVDGWPRAFTFEVETVGRELVMRERLVPVLLRAPTRITGKDYQVAALPDFALRDVEFEVQLTNARNAQLQVSQRIDVDKLRSLTINGTDDGGLAFDLEWKEWTETWPAQKDDARCELTAQVFRKSDQQPVGQRMSLPLLFDATNPTVVEWRPQPSIEQKGRLSLAALGEDRESGIVKAEFGIARSADKEPDFWEPGDRVGDRFARTLEAPAEPGEYQVFVRFTNGVGLVATARAGLTVVKAPPKGAIVTGVLVRNSLPQSKVDVKLIPIPTSGTPQEAPTPQTRTNDQGRFTFDNVPPGKYRMEAVQGSGVKPFRARAELTVEPGAKKDLGELTLKD